MFSDVSCFLLLSSQQISFSLPVCTTIVAVGSSGSVWLVVGLLMRMVPILLGNHDRHQTMTKRNTNGLGCLVSNTRMSASQDTLCSESCNVAEWFCVIGSWTVNAYGTDPRSSQAPNEYTEEQKWVWWLVTPSWQKKEPGKCKKMSSYICLATEIYV